MNRSLPLPPPSSKSPERLPSLSREAFYETVGRREQPVILTQAMEDWPARGKWSFDWFATEHGDVTAPVEWLQYTQAPGGRVERVGKVQRMTLREYIQQLRGPASHEAGYLIGKDLLLSLPALREDLQFPEYEAVSRLTEQLFFMGPAGSFTQLHLDRAHNLHAVLAGRKRWQLYPPSMDAQLKPAALDHPWSVVSEYDLAPTYGRPEQLPNGLAPAYDFVLEAGEILFLPYGWWHRVLTLENAIATNLWWWTWSMLSRLGPVLIPSIAMSAVSKMRRQAREKRYYRESA